MKYSTFRTAIHFGAPEETAIFPVHSPMLADVNVVRRGSVRRAKLYYLRQLTGKATRIKERKVKPAASQAGAAQ